MNGTPHPRFADLLPVTGEKELAWESFPFHPTHAS